MDPDEFIAVMKRWMNAFTFREGSDLTGATNDELGAIAVPTLIFEGNDDVHPRETSDMMARMIPGATYLPSPWSTDDFMGRLSGRVPGPVFDLYPRLVPDIATFLASHEG
jgi:pimeloyl-ACP methyl ester carboxylesterase